MIIDHPHFKIETMQICGSYSIFFLRKEEEGGNLKIKYYSTRFFGGKLESYNQVVRNRI